MRFSKLFFLMVLMSLMACQEQGRDAIYTPKALSVNSLTAEANALILKPEEGLVYHKGKPFTGASVTYYGNGNLASQIDFLNGKKHGLYKKWYEDGLLSFESQYVAGKQDGKTYTWWKNGHKRSASTYSNGLLNGKQLQWYSSGVQFKEINLENGKEEGLQKAWRENGKLYCNYEAKNGRIFGLKRANLCYGLDDENIQFKD